MEPDDKVKLREVLRLLCLSLGQYLGGGKVLKVFVIYNNINRIGLIFQIMLPNFEDFKNNK